MNGRPSIKRKPPCVALAYAAFLLTGLNDGDEKIQGSPRSGAEAWVRPFVAQHMVKHRPKMARVFGSESNVSSADRLESLNGSPRLMACVSRSLRQLLHIHEQSLVALFGKGREKASEVLEMVCRCGMTDARMSRDLT